MSALFPIDTNVDRPKPSSAAWPMTAMPSAPLWERNPTRPAGGHVVANVPLRCTSGSVFTTPMQFGPISRMPGCPAHLEELALQRRHPPGLFPRTRTEITTSPRTPLLAALARDGDHGVGGHRDERHVDVDRARPARWRYAAMPCTTADFGLTACTTPANGGSSRLWRSRPPIDCASRDAPITATDVGLEDRTDRVRRRDPLAALVRRRAPLR